MWSLGVLLYALSHGQMPWQVKDDMPWEVRRQTVTADIPYDRHLDEDFVALIRSMLSANPRKRPTMAAVMKNPFFKKSWSK